MKTEQFYLDEAKQHEQRKFDSIENCDTDGFVSQWASDLCARESRLKAVVAKHNGRYWFDGLYHGDRRVLAKKVNGRFGASWLLHSDEADRYGRKFIPFAGHGRKSNVQKKLGLTERRELAAAWVAMQGGTCQTHARPVAFRTGCKWGSDADLIES